TDLERRFLDLGRQPAVLHQVFDIVLEPAPQALAARVDELLERRRIGVECIGRRKRIDDDRCEQARARLVEFTQATLTHECVDGASPGEIGLEQAAVQIAAFPRGVGEPPVPGLRTAVRPVAILPSSPMNHGHWLAAMVGSLATALSTVAALASRSSLRRPTSGLSAKVLRAAWSDIISARSGSGRGSLLIGVLRPE